MNIRVEGWGGMQILHLCIYHVDVFHLQAISGDELQYTLYGKPERVTYEYAEKLLMER